MRIHAELDAIGMRNTIGVTTGQVYTGSVGSTARQEYAMVGDVVNLAARLMVAGTKLGKSILCDHATYAASCAHTSYVELEPISVKGKKSKIRIYEPEARRFRPRFPSAYVIGRLGEKMLLERKVTALAERGDSSVVLIEGVEGMGKSILASYARHLAVRHNVRVLYGIGDPMNREPFFAWGAVLMDLLALPDHVTAEVAQGLHGALERKMSPDWFRLTPLMADVLPELRDAFPENATVRGMSRRQRTDNTINLIKHLMQSHVCGPVLVVIENVHCLDNASLKALLNVRKGMLAFMVLCTTRPVPEPRPDLLQEVYQLKSTAVLELGPLSVSSCCMIAELRLGITESCETLRTLVAQAVPSVQGNPYFIVQFATSLRDSGFIALGEHGSVRVSRAAKEQQNSAALPEAVVRIINARIDRLSASAQMVLKVASVIGSNFSLSVLQAVYPIEGEKRYLEQELNLLCTLNIIALKGKSARDANYFFTTETIREVSYSRMLFSQRKQLHEVLANYYQTQLDDPTSTTALAHHWGKVALGEQSPSNGVVLVALRYTKLASEQALHHEAKKEAPKSEESAVLERDALAKLSSFPTSREEQQQDKVPLLRTLSRLQAESPENILKKMGIPDPNAADSSGWSKLHNAASKADLPLLEALLSHELVDVNAKNMNGNTALHYFVRSWDSSQNPMCERILQLFIWRGAGVNYRNGTNETPLHSACLYGKIDAVEALLACGADVNATNAEGETCLHYVARSGNGKIIEVLLSHGAKAYFGEGPGTPLALVKKTRKERAVELIQEATEREQAEAKAVEAKGAEATEAGGAEEETKE
eukprot:TRINITY_DN2959_c0_g1_i6.p1 TRINITY_DN2959_c0_g1~~TRINITY_DN2959_c0_g1_i6.p1  ORF type:complete len:911 (-),score=383.45 TRINITY_DN2959_c0_g1_i6:73-2541(-)